MNADVQRKSGARMLTKQIVFAVLNVVSGMLFFALYLIIPHFHEVLVSFGGQIPAITRAVISAAHFFPVICVIYVLFSVTTGFAHKFSVAVHIWFFRIAAILFVIAFLSYLIAFVALYLPIFSVDL